MLLSKDTPLEIEKVQLELFRKASPGKRFALMSSFSSTLRRASQKQYEQRFSDPVQAKLEWVRLHYGDNFAKGLQGKLKTSRSHVNETEQALRDLIVRFEKVGISYRIVGSVASSIQGVTRATLDVDMVANINPSQITTLVEGLGKVYYLDTDMVQEAVQRRSSFNLIHLETMIKIDVFILGQRTYDSVSFERERLESLGEEGLTLSFKTPEDIILGKLEWFLQTEKTSERQWRDILGLIKVQGSLLDMKYMRQWAKELTIESLLEQAFVEAKD
jgi:hypothetical protein